MGLELKKGRDGQLVMTWYGRYTENGKRVSVALCAVDGTPPSSLSIRDKGDNKFEVSREKAEGLLSSHQKEAGAKGKADHLTERLIEAKTGRKVEYAKLADLPALWRGIDRDGGAPTERYLKWCDSVFIRFVESTPCEFLYEVQKEHVKAFLDGMRKNRTHKTVKDMTILLRVAFNRLLPVGTVNPFVESIRRRKARGAVTGGTVARRPLTLEQLEILYETARTDPLIYGLTVCAASTGMRIGDVCQLRWQSVDLRAGWVKVATSKTGVSIEVPIFAKLREVLENVLSDRDPEAVHVWPEAARMYDVNRNGVYYRGKVLFAQAFADTPPNALKQVADKSERVTLADVLPQVTEAVKVRFDGVKRDRILDTLARYARGQSYRQIEAETGRRRSQTSEDLREAEEVSGLLFRKGASVASMRDLKTLIGKTRQKRETGCYAASLLGWHNLRGTFVTLALDAGIPFETVSKCTGHTTAKTVRDHYYNPTREHTKQAMRKVGAQLSGKQHTALNADKADPVAAMAAQLQSFTPEQRAQLSEILKGGK
ncbi:MAG: site-specific integrase [Kiritimatiellia bacterium]